jgi:hypothetical protein
MRLYNARIDANICAAMNVPVSGGIESAIFAPLTPFSDSLTPGLKNRPLLKSGRARFIQTRM